MTSDLLLTNFRMTSPKGAQPLKPALPFNAPRLRPDASGSSLWPAHQSEQVMDAEQIKLIADTISSLGENAKTGVIWWLVAEYGARLLTVALWVGALTFLVKKAFDAWKHACRTSAEKLNLSLSDALYEAARNYWLRGCVGNKDKGMDDLDAFKVFKSVEEMLKKHGHME